MAQRLVQGQDWDTSGSNAVHEKDQAINKLESQVEEQVRLKLSTHCDVSVKTGNKYIKVQGMPIVRNSFFFLSFLFNLVVTETITST